MKNYTFTNDLLKRAAVVLMILALLLVPLQVQAIGHGERLMIPAAESEAEAVIVGREVSPDMLIAMIEAERSAVSALARFESPDMVMARAEAEGTVSTPTPLVDTTVPGVNLWVLAILFTLIIAMGAVLVLWERLFPVKEEDIERASSRCSLIGESC